MSLINEALKKAQRQRSGDTLKEIPGVYETPSGRMERRGSSSKGQTILLLAAGAVVLIVLSAVVAVFVVNRSPEAPVKTTIIASTKSLPPVDLDAPSPTIVAPVITPPPRAAEPTPIEPLHTSPTEAESISVAPIATTATASEPVAATPVAIPPISRAPQADPKIWAFVDAVHVTGVRTSDKVGKVLMNDRVYRVNDYVDRTLGVKLAKIAEDQLTFVDENGFMYTKSL